jgi:hypothetical protein
VTVLPESPQSRVSESLAEMEPCPRCQLSDRVRRKLVLINPWDEAHAAAHPHWRVTCACQGDLTVDSLRPEFISQGPSAQFIQALYPDIESDIQMSSKNIESSLFEGADKLVPFFRTWPCFHDAEIVELHLWRGHVYAGDWDDRNIFPILTIKVLVLEATQPGATGAGNDVLVTLRFHDVDQVELRDFNHNNSIVGLSVNKQSRGAAEDELAPYLAVVLEQGFGLSASFRCFRVEILSVEQAPSGPIGKSEP